MHKSQINSDKIIDSHDPEIFELETSAEGPKGSLPLTEEMLLNAPSGDIFAMSQNAGMGWNPEELNHKQFLIVSTQGGLRAGAPSHGQYSYVAAAAGRGAVLVRSR